MQDLKKKTVAAKALRSKITRKMKKTDDDDDDTTYTPADEDEGAGGEGGEKKEFDLMKTIASRFMVLVALGSLVVYVVAIVRAIDRKKEATSMLIAGGLAIPIALIVMWQEFQLQDIDSLRKVQKKIREDVNVFAKHNKELASKNEELTKQNEGLKQVEGDLDALAEERGADVEQLIELVEENRLIAIQESEIARQELTQTIIKILVDIDHDRSASISEENIERVVSRLGTEKRRIKVNEELLMEKIRADSSLYGLIKLTRDLNRHDKPESERVFVLLQNPPEEY